MTRGLLVQEVLFARIMQRVEHLFTKGTSDLLYKADSFNNLIFLFMHFL